MAIEAYYQKSNHATPLMIKIVKYYIEHISEHGVLPLHKVACIDLELKATHLAGEFKRMIERGFMEKIGDVGDNGQPEGYRFHPTRMGLQESE
jgi:hypothetical protein